MACLRPLRHGLRLLLLALLAGCATAPKDAPPFSLEALPQDPAYAVVVVYRALVTPLAKLPTVSVNGVEAVDMPNEAFTWFQLKPGHYAFRNDWDFSSGNPAGGVDIDLQAGQRYYIEITGDTEVPLSPAAGAVHLAGNFATFHTAVQGRGFVPQDAQQAVQALVNCCRYVPLGAEYVAPGPLLNDIPATDASKQ